MSDAQRKLDELRSNLHTVNELHFKQSKNSFFEDRKLALDKFYKIKFNDPSTTIKLDQLYQEDFKDHRKIEYRKLSDSPAIKTFKTLKEAPIDASYYFRP